MINVLLLIGETVEVGLGGLSTHVRGLLNNMNDDVHFHIIGKETQKFTQGKNYTYYPIEKQTIYNFERVNTFDVITDMRFDAWQFMDKAIQVIHTHPNISIVHACDWQMGLVGLHLKKIYGLKMLFAVHLSMLYGSEEAFYSPKVDEKYFLYNYSNMSSAFAIEEQSIRNADFVTFVSKDYKNYFSRRLSDAQFNCKVIYNGINIEDFAIPKPDHLNDRLTFLYCGRLANAKGIHEMLDAFLLYSQKNENVKPVLKIMGGTAGGDADVISKVSSFSKVFPDTFEWIGYKTGKEKIMEYKKADVIIMPSKHEPFGIVALEAMASGKLFICSGVNGLAEIVNENNCILCDHSEKGILEAIDKAVNIEDDEKNTLITNALKDVKQFNWSTPCTQYYNIYKDLC